MRRAVMVGIVVVGALAVMGILVGGGLFQGTAVAPTATPLQSVPAFTDIVAEGKAIPRRAAELGAAVAGVVAEVPAAEGDTVAAGALLIRLDAGAADAAVESAQGRVDAAAAGVTVAKAAVDQAAAGVDRAVAALRGARATRDLVPDGASAARKRAADASVDGAQASLKAARAAERGTRAALTAAEADQRTAEATLAGARSAREQLDIAAPFAGTVVSVSVAVGDAVSPGPPVVRLAADDGWEFQTTEVDAAVVPSITVGGPASVSVDGFPGVEIPCRVARISAYGEERQGDVLFTVVVQPTGTVPDGIRWNMTATITIGAAR